MTSSVPHPIPYQGSKRRLAEAILSYMRQYRCRRLIEPFVGSGAITLAAAKAGFFDEYVISDVLLPLTQIWEKIVEEPANLADAYQSFWERERLKPIDAYYEIRTEFNSGRDPAKLLFLLARCVKNAVRFNPAGEFNQSPDKRRTGTRPETMRQNLFHAHLLLHGRSAVACNDFFEAIHLSRLGDFVYLDPPYQGTSEGRDRRYIAGVERTRVIESLEILNRKGVPFILSYDGACGDTAYGESIPGEIAAQVLLGVGRSSQATLNGSDHVTVESLYLSPLLATHEKAIRLELNDFRPQAILFA